MSQRLYDFSHLTEQDLELIATWYPDAIQIVRKPVYRVLAMLANCKARLPEGVSLISPEPIAVPEIQTAQSTPLVTPAPAITMPHMPDNTTEPDVDGWGKQWTSYVQAAPNVEWLRDLRKKNATVLSSFSKRNPAKHAECIAVYDEKLKALGGAGA